MVPWVLKPHTLFCLQWKSDNNSWWKEKLTSSLCPFCQVSCYGPELQSSILTFSNVCTFSVNRFPLSFDLEDRPIYFPHDSCWQLLHNKTKNMGRTNMFYKITHTYMTAIWQQLYTKSILKKIMTIINIWLRWQNNFRVESWSSSINTE